jgi:hypothetical protein
LLADVHAAKQTDSRLVERNNDVSCRALAF